MLKGLQFKIKLIGITFYLSWTVNAQELFESTFIFRQQGIYGFLLRSRVTDKVDINLDIFQFQENIIGSPLISQANIFGAFRFSPSVRLIGGISVLNRYRNDSLTRHINEWRPWIGLQYQKIQKLHSHTLRLRNEFRIIDNLPQQEYGNTIRSRFDYQFKEAIYHHINTDNSLSYNIQLELFFNLNKNEVSRQGFEQISFANGLDYTFKKQWNTALAYLLFLRPNFNTDQVTFVHSFRIMLTKQFDFRKRN